MIAQRPSLVARPIDRSGSPMCRGDVHRHCSKCGVADQTVAETKPLNGPPWPATCSSCTVKAMRVRAVVKAVQALEAGMEG